MPALFIPAAFQTRSIRAAFPYPSQEELPSAQASRSCTGNTPYPHHSSGSSPHCSSRLTKGARFVWKWETTATGHLTNYFKMIGTSEMQKVHEAACAESTMKCVPNILHLIFFIQSQPKAQREWNFLSILVSQSGLNELFSDSSACVSNPRFLTYKARMQIIKAMLCSHQREQCLPSHQFLQKELECLFALVSSVILIVRKLVNVMAHFGSSIQNPTR